jgi:hypothetical protein
MVDADLVDGLRGLNLHLAGRRVDAVRYLSLYRYQDLAPGEMERGRDRRRKWRKEKGRSNKVARAQRLSSLQISSWLFLLQQGENVFL